MRWLFTQLFRLATVIIVFEAIVGNWIGPARWNPLIQIRNIDTLFPTGEIYYPTEAPVHYKRDSFGLRGEYGGDPSKIDILTVGGSTTDQRFVTEGATWQDVLRDQLASIGKKLNVVNAGVDGRSSFGHIRDFESWFSAIPGLKPKFILFYVGANELFCPEDSIDVEKAKKAYRILEVKEVIKRNSAFWHVYSTTRSLLFNHRFFDARHRRIDFKTLSWGHNPLQTHHDQLATIPLRNYEKRLRILDELAKKYSTRVIYVTQSKLWYKFTAQGFVGTQNGEIFNDRPINGVDQYFFLKLVNQITMKVCRETQGICLDLFSDLHFDDEDFYDFAHNTPRGAKKIGLYLAEQLRNLL